MSASAWFALRFAVCFALRFARRFMLRFAGRIPARGALRHRRGGFWRCVPCDISTCAGDFP
jgi:hypothetical protein